MKVFFDGQPCFLHFYVCDVPYCVVSVGRLWQQGYQAHLTSLETMTLETPNGSSVPILRHGSLLFLKPEFAPFDVHEFEQACESFHEGSSQGGLLAPTFNPVYYNTDKWELSGNTLVRTQSVLELLSFRQMVPRTDLYL